MKCRQFLAIFAGALAMASVAGADTVALKNGDRLTGTVEVSDGKDVTLKTDFAGEIKIQWSAVLELKTDKPIYVVTPDKKTVSGTVTTDGPNLIVHTANNGTVPVPLAQVTVVRSSDVETAYEKSLHPSLLEAWKGGASLGFAIARGNSETTNLTTGFNADRKTLHDELTFYEASLYSDNNQPGGDVLANSILGGVKYDRNITKRLFVFVSADYTHDALQDLNLRQIYSGGLGVHLINTPNTTLDALAGVNYTRETYGGGTTAPTVDRNLAGITLGEDFMHKFGKSTTFTEVFYFYPDLSNTGEYRFALDAASVTKINKWLGWQTTLTDRYVTNPPIVGTKSNDIIFSTGINVSFTH
jgi:putative salt-induced outer membrane protein YdiY